MSVLLSVPAATGWRRRQRHPVLIRNHPIAREIVFAYAFHEARGAFVYDRVKPMYHGSWTLGATQQPLWKPSNLGPVLDINNVIPNNNAPGWSNNYVTSMSSGTLEVIVRANRLHNGGSLTALGGFIEGGGQNFILIAADDTSGPGDGEWYKIVWGNKRTWYMSNGLVYDRLPRPIVGEWYQLIATNPVNGTIRLWVNGVTYDSAIRADVTIAGSQTITPPVNPGVGVIPGGSGSSHHWDIASCRFWKRELSATEIGVLFRDPWIIYEEAQSSRRTVARIGLSGAQVLEADLVVDGDLFFTASVANVGSVTSALLIDGDVVFDATVASDQTVSMDSIVVDGDVIYGALVFAEVLAIEDIPSVDIGGSRDEVFVQIEVTGLPDFVIEGSEDDENFVAISPVLHESTIWELDRKFPYARVRKISGAGTLRVIWGPQEGRVSGHEKDVVSPRIRYSNRDSRKVH